MDSVNPEAEHPVTPPEPKVFTNERIDTDHLPRFEDVPFSRLHPKHWRVVLIDLAIGFGIAGIGAGCASVFIEELVPFQLWIAIGFIAIFAIVIGFCRLSFVKKGYAFREHDVLFRSGVIATNTLIVPYNRVQHVALHEGAVSRLFGLAKIQVFTAGAQSGDIDIPGIKKEKAENIKQLLMGKIRKEL